MAADFRIGVEEEYQLVDRRTGALRSRARDVLATDWSDEIVAELQETMLEVGTHICANTTELRAELGRLRFQVATAAAVEELNIAALGTHPFSRWEGQRTTPRKRYFDIVERYGQIARDEHNFGMHIHVEVPAGTDRVRLMNVVRHYLPHLLALSGSSPFFEGHDTGYASYRTILWRRWPNAGVPPRFESEAEYDRMVQTMLRTGVLRDKGNVYWAVRPHARYPTLEFRVTDVCLRVDDAVAIAALARALVRAAAEGVIREPDGWGFDPDAGRALLEANEWRAARYGTEARLLDPAGADGQVAVRAAIGDLVRRLRPIAREMGDEEALDSIHEIFERGGAADRIRAACEEAGGFEPLVEWVTAETLLGTGLDRRAAQRGGLPA